MNPSKMTKEMFLERANIVYKNTDIFDYSEMEYKDGNTDVKIWCKEHGGFFSLKPHAHLCGCGCPICHPQPKQFSNEEFIRRSKCVHGDAFGYDRCNFKNVRTKVEIFCKKHEDYFLQNPNAHLKGFGCGVCSGKTQLSKEDFVRKARAIHGDAYEYSSVDYNKTYTKVKIKCNRCENVWETTPNAHLNGGGGCPACKYIKISEQSARTQEEFINLAKAKHGDKYDYSLVEYKNGTSPIRIICKKHNDIFTQIPHDHLTGRGCPRCGRRGDIWHTAIMDRLKEIGGYEMVRDGYNFIRSPKSGHKLQLDIYFPQLKKAVELNGKWCHDDYEKKHPGAHAAKALACVNAGIKLLNIDYGEWLKSQDAVIEKIIAFLEND